jgi:REP element-mobilizing transposase RayT
MNPENPYRNKYKYKGGSPRLFGYDYASEGYYFITICTRDRINYFGSINSGKIRLSEEGRIVEEEWFKTGEIRKDQRVDLDEFCIMPNHIHRIVKIGDPVLPTKDNRIPFSDFKINQFGPQIKNLSSIIRGFKGSCTNRIHEYVNPDFGWQRRFYDHIIRDLTSLEKIRHYIRCNSMNWKSDELS